MSPTTKDQPNDNSAQTKVSAKGGSIDTAGLHHALHQASLMQAEEITIRAAFRRVIETHTTAVGVGHVTRDPEGNWDLRPNHATGRLPRRSDFVEAFSENCDVAVVRDCVQIVPFLGMNAIYAPIIFSDGTSEVLLLLVDEASTHSAVFVVEIATAYLSLSLSQARTQNNDWKLVSLAALIELVSQIEMNDRVASGSQVIANELVRHVGASQVAVGFVRAGQLRVESLSGTAHLDPASEIYHGLEMAMNESLLRGEVGMYPPRDEDGSHLLIAHRQLAGDLNAEAVMTTPLTTTSGDTIGVLLLSGSVELLHGNRLPNFVRAASPRIAGALEVVSRAESTKLGRATRWIGRTLKTTRGLTWCLATLLLTALMAMPVQYRIRCTCSTEPTLRRFAVAPFDGQINTGYVKAGDLVKKGQLLAKMDGQSIRWELASVVAEYGQASKQREIELAARNVPGSMLSQLESNRLRARKNLLDYRSSQIEIRSPIDGVVLSGSLERAEGAAVTLGETVFEIGPLNQMRVEVVVPAEEIAHVKVGQSLRIWMDGLSGASMLAKVERIRPRSELREARNVFVAEVTVLNEGDRLRAGMKGRVRIDGEVHSLGWNIFHRPWEYLAARLTWW